MTILTLTQINKAE